MLTRLRLLLVAAALVLPQWTVPALAGTVIRADFDGDGVLDTATVTSDARPFVDIAVSGARRPLRVALRERPLSLVAADLDRDGRIDLAGLTPHSGLLLLRNRGERFVRLRRSNPRRSPDTGGIVERGRGTLGTPLPSGSDVSNEEVRHDDLADGAVDPRAGPASRWTPVAHAPARRASSGHRGRSASRAPPV